MSRINMNVKPKSSFWRFFVVKLPPETNFERFFLFLKNSYTKSKPGSISNFQTQQKLTLKSPTSFAVSTNKSNHQSVRTSRTCQQEIDSTPVQLNPALCKAENIVDYTMPNGSKTSSICVPHTTKTDARKCSAAKTANKTSKIDFSFLHSFTHKNCSFNTKILDTMNLVTSPESHSAKLNSSGPGVKQVFTEPKTNRAFLQRLKACSSTNEKNVATVSSIC